MPDTFVFDLAALCEFAAHIARETAQELGIELTHAQWPAVGAAVKSYIEAQLERAAFAAEAQAEIAALPVTHDGVTQESMSHRTEFGL